MVKIYNGRPEVLDGRSDTEIKVYDTLDELGIEYLSADHEAAFTMEACREVDEAFGVSLCKNLFLCNRQKTRYYLLLMPDDKPFKTKELSAQINSARLSFAGEEDMVRLLGVTPGSVTVMGLLNDTDHEVTLLVDRDLADCEYFGCHPCVNTSSLKVRSDDIFGKFIAHTGHTATYVDLVGAD